MPSIESAVIRVVIDVSDQLSPRLAEEVELRRSSATTAAAEALLADLDRNDVEALEAYLGSPDFAAVVVQKRIGDIMDKTAKDQLCEGLRLAHLSDHLLAEVTDIVFDLMAVACQEVKPQFAGTNTKIDRSDLFIAAKSTSTMLKRLKSLTRIHSFAARMRGQVAALHNRIRMPHVGVSRAVRYDQLYVEPTLTPPLGFRLGVPGERVLIQGDPGAGKSTLAAKFAHDIATDGSGRVPFLVVLRQFAVSFDEGGRDLTHYLEKLCHAPYNVKPPHDGVEYLLRTGRAVVILDGLDELVQTELRRRVVSLVEGFAHLHPLVPILVTARKIGYRDAPLSLDLFFSCHIAEFDDGQVSSYVRRWFELDEATSPSERERLISSFVEDSEQIPELRSNPLLLTLLCAMYSSDRYLPRNLAQVYERCALMLFEQWDSKRGIALPLKFHGRLRGAVQHLAWKMFNATESGRPQSRTRIVNILSGYLEAKLDDHDESAAMAEEFLAFCTGRAWILTDVGATESEPQFGFTHRTFLEFFAAEYLVRAHRTAADLWAVLSPKHEQWDVVAQIVLQLYDRNVEDGVDELLMVALDDHGIGFAARALHHVHPSNRTVRAIATAAVDRSVRLPLDLRIDVDRARLSTADAPLRNCMYASSPVNLPIVAQAVADRFRTLIELGEAGAAVVLDVMPAHDPGETGRLWRELQHDLVTEHEEQLAELWQTIPWIGGWARYRPEIVPEILRRFGVRVCYTRLSFVDTEIYSLAWMTMENGPPTFPPTEARDIAITITTLTTPWITSGELRGYRKGLHRDLISTDVLKMVLALPFLETREPERSLSLSWLYQDELPPQVFDFLKAWERGEISVLEPDPESRPPHPEQH